MKKELTLDALLRIRLPINMCNALNMSNGTKIILTQEQDKIIITKAGGEKYCEKCNSSFASNSNYCTYCGTSLVTVEE